MSKLLENFSPTTKDYLYGNDCVELKPNDKVICIDNKWSENFKDTLPYVRPTIGSIYTVREVVRCLVTGYISVKLWELPAIIHPNGMTGGYLAGHFNKVILEEIR